MPTFARALLWIVFIVAPGGVLLLPLLVGGTLARRKKAAAVVKVDVAPAALAARLSTR